jgi:3'-phosphoadenosine 5'-phosphosulfate sulfotransferase (PAPS reductase)/FAD synthetase
MENPYRIERPAIISFSGGRTSGYMLWHILDAFDGMLPSNIHVAFANTGKEREETLRFVHECATRWNIKVHWLEFVSRLKRTPVSERFDEVGYNSASRSGEPFDRLIAAKKAIPSTVSGRWCTQYLKVRTMIDFMGSLGFNEGEFHEAIGFRADEYDRVYELPRKPSNASRRLVFPLANAGVRKADVMNWWAKQPFDLQLKRGTGNCDHCPFLSAKNRVHRARLNPSGIEWWENHEINHGGFSFGRESFSEIRRHIASSPMMLLDEEHADMADTECMGWCGS